MDVKIRNKVKGLDNIAKYVFIIGLIFVIISPILFTRGWGLLDFTKTGEIGDTIGGLTAPIIGLIGAVLIFLSFREQWISNQIQLEIINKNKEDQLKAERLDLVWRLYSEIKNDLMNPKVTEYNEQMIKNRGLNKEESEKIYYILHPSINNLKLLLTVFKGMNEGRIDKNYGSIFMFKFEILIGIIETFKDVNSSMAIKDKFDNQLNELNNLQKELRELKWEKQETKK